MLFNTLLFVEALMKMDEKLLEGKKKWINKLNPRQGDWGEGEKGNQKDISII